MKSQKIQTHQLREFETNPKLKLAVLWASIMFLYIYIDYFHLYMTGEIDNIRNGIVYKFNINQNFLLAALSVVTIPSLMIFLSVVMRANINRWVNIVIAALYIPITLFNLAGVYWIHMVVAAVVEVVLLCLIIGYAWQWPRFEK